MTSNIHKKQQGHAECRLDDFVTGRWHNIQAVQTRMALEGLPFSAETIEGRILEPGTLAAAMRDIDHVFHQAALPSVAFSLKEPL
jgi:nucleoside-diphosphate-sugar epimerase